MGCHFLLQGFPNALQIGCKNKRDPSIISRFFVLSQFGAKQGVGEDFEHNFGAINFAY